MDLEEKIINDRKKSVETSQWRYYDDVNFKIIILCIVELIDEKYVRLVYHF